jgi:hypothetical protein
VCLLRGTDWIFIYNSDLWSPYVPPCLTFRNTTFYPHGVFMCFMWISEQTAIISLYSIVCRVCITETECVYCALRACISLYIIQVNFPLWRTNKICQYLVNVLLRSHSAAFVDYDRERFQSQWREFSELWGEFCYTREGIWLNVELMILVIMKRGNTSWNGFMKWACALRLGSIGSWSLLIFFTISRIFLPQTCTA